MSITYHVCKYTPTELLTALGGQCALLDEAPENFDLSDQVAHPNLCGFGKSVIQAALAGQVKEVYSPFNGPAPLRHLFAQSTRVQMAACDMSYEGIVEADPTKPYEAMAPDR